MKRFIKSIKSKNKKIILFSIGNNHRFNNFYFGHNKAYSELCNWEENKAIIKLLINYQEKYHIVIKDYHYSATSLTLQNLINLDGDQLN